MVSRDMLFHLDGFADAKDAVSAIIAEENMEYDEVIDTLNSETETGML